MDLSEGFRHCVSKAEGRGGAGAPPVTALTSSLDGSKWAHGLDLPCLRPGAPEQSLQWRPCPKHLPLVSQAVIFARRVCSLSVSDLALCCQEQCQALASQGGRRV